MDAKLEGKSVIVTAASKGLGRATALEFAREGAHVLIASRNEEGLLEARDEIIRVTGNHQIKYAVCDVTDPKQITAMVQTAVTWNGTVDVLINNAGGPPPGRFADFGDDAWQQAFELNLLSFIRTTREVLPYMKKQKSGRIVNFASSSIKEVIDGLILSNTFRAGIVGFSKSVAREVAAENILINTVGPGRIATDRLAQIDQNRAESQSISFEEAQAQVLSEIPAGRYGEPEEFAKIVVFLASGANTYLTGQSLVIDGGMMKAI